MKLFTNMRTLKAAAGALLLGLASLAHSSVVLQTSTSTAGAVATVDISATNRDATRAVGGFELELLYDAALWSPSGVQFSQFLGDLSNFEALTDFDFSVAGVVKLLSISLLGPFDPLPLSAIQPVDGSPFLLATVSFDAMGSGLGGFRLGHVTLLDEFGEQIQVVPEPSTVATLSLGLLALVAVRRRKTSQPTQASAPLSA
ncbi:PEP-CTERM sorting domain-containing protein [Pseudorhodoferax sp.]|uniref:PEP-CTERM sorting domain-containing protein n=1 Tax=Pseudorhodoferax sp. TaxID=1993553 RepID=UPI002DD62F7E|nr:PEP-CTERM sorting domain-containing protein [Pseudorhodoferax sp.]